MLTQTNLLLIKYFNQLVAMARTMKNCNYFFADSVSRVLYGINPPSVVRFLNMPLNVILPTSLMFKVSNIDFELVSKYSDFAYDPDKKTMHILNTGEEEDIVIDLNPQNRAEYLAYQQCSVILYNFHNTMQNQIALTADVFGNMENDPIVQEIASGKVTDGARYLRLTGMSGKQYGFMIWKNLFSINKGDRLTIRIYDKINDGRLFVVKFEVEKKKSPIPAIIPQYMEQSYCMYINM